MPISAKERVRDTGELPPPRGPRGREDEVAEVCRRRLEEICDEVSVDAAENLVGLIRGESRAPGIKVMPHMDEISLCVKRIDGDDVGQLADGARAHQFAQADVGGHGAVGEAHGEAQLRMGPDRGRALSPLPSGLVAAGLSAKTCRPAERHSAMSSAFSWNGVKTPTASRFWSSSSFLAAKSFVPY